MACVAVVGLASDGLETACSAVSNECQGSCLTVSCTGQTSCISQPTWVECDGVRTYCPIPTCKRNGCCNEYCAECTDPDCPFEICVPDAYCADDADCGCGGACNTAHSCICLIS
jgi:hypothetical protein